MLSLGPRLGSEVFDLPVGRGWQPGEHVAQVGVRVDASPPATLDDGIDNRAAIASIGFTNERKRQAECL